MMRVAIFGIGRQFFQAYDYELARQYDIVCLADNNQEKQGTYFAGRKILNIDEMLETDFDCVLVVPNIHKLDMMKLLLNRGVACNKIIPWMPTGGIRWEKRNIVYRGDDCLCQFDNVLFICRTSADFLIMNEIFIYGSYSFHLDSTDIVAIDIGMNVGIATLFFASHPNIGKVYSFEPFPKTYERALENFSLNDASIKQKIISRNVALSDHESDGRFSYYFDLAGGCNILPSDDADVSNTAEVKIKRASVILSEIIADNPDKRIFVKLDAEGSEYAIFDDMQSNGILNKISMLIIETHGSRENELMDVLRENSFSYFYHSNGEGLGMLYAVKHIV